MHIHGEGISDTLVPQVLDEEWDCFCRFQVPQGCCQPRHRSRCGGTSERVAPSRDECLDHGAPTLLGVCYRRDLILAEMRHVSILRKDSGNSFFSVGRARIRCLRPDPLCHTACRRCGHNDDEDHHKAPAPPDPKTSQYSYGVIQIYHLSAGGCDCRCGIFTARLR